MTLCLSFAATLVFFWNGHMKYTSELLTPKGMSFEDTNTSSLFLLLPIIAF